MDPLQEEARTIKRLSALTMLQGIVVGVLLSVWAVLASMQMERQQDVLFFGARLGLNLLVPFSMILGGLLVFLSWKREELRARLPRIWGSSVHQGASLWFGRFLGLLLVSGGVLALVPFYFPTLDIGFFPFIFLPVATALGVNGALTWFGRKRNAPQRHMGTPALSEHEQTDTLG